MIRRLFLTFIILFSQVTFSMDRKLRPRKRIKYDDNDDYTEVTASKYTINWGNFEHEPNSATVKIIHALTDILLDLNNGSPNILRIHICEFNDERYKNPQWLINLGDEEGHTALHVAVVQKNISIIKKLYTLGADPNVTDTIGRTPLHYAAVRGYTSIVEHLLKCFTTDKTIKDVFNKTAYDLAVANGHEKTAEIIKKLQLAEGLDALCSKFFQI